MKNLFVIILVSLLTVGCVSFQPSTYSNRNTPNGNVVNATGNAAAAAASANHSYNCPSCTSSSGQQSTYPGGYSGVGYTNTQTNYVDTIADSAAQTLANSISISINREIYKIFR